jgi:MFS family permease
MATDVAERGRVEPRPPLRLPFYYGWVNLVVAAVAMTGTLPGATHGLGLITEPMLADLKVDKVFYGTLSFWAIILGAAFCLPGGRLIDRLGTRRVLMLVSAALGGVVLLMSAVTDWPLLFVCLVLVRGLAQGILSVASMALIGKWFSRRLGLAMGVFAVLLTFGFIAATLGLGQSVLAFGWRSAWAGLGLTLLCGLAPLSWLLVRSTPEACGLTIEGVAALPDLVQQRAEDASLSQALKTPAFWAFSLAIALFGLFWFAITLYNQGILAEHGLDAQTSYLVLSLLTAGGLASNLLGGWLSTRWPLGRLLGIAMLLLAGAAAYFPQVRTTGQVVLYALVLGVAGGLITLIHFTFYGQAFGRKNLGLIQGSAQIVSVFASALGPLLAALCYERTGSYDGMFYTVAPLALILGLAAWLVPTVKAEECRPVLVQSAVLAEGEA